MKNLRIIARLDIKGPNIIKGVQFECLRVMGKPEILAEKYYLEGADEIIYIDNVASLYQRPIDLNLVNKTAQKIFVPFTVGGGLKTITDIRATLKAGGDKVALNTAAIRNPHLIAQAVQVFGSQCIVVSIAAKKIQPGQWEAYTDNAREPSGVDVVAWAKKAQELGAGEIILTSVDQDGTQEGFDLELIEAVTKVLSIPLIVCGGAGKIDDFIQSAAIGTIDGIAAGSVLHYDKLKISAIKAAIKNNSLHLRKISLPAKVDFPKLLGEPSIEAYNIYTIQQLAEEKKEAPKSTPAPKVLINQKPPVIGIVNYGINNLYSVAKAFNLIGRSTKLVETPEQIQAAKCLVLPGMGAFPDGMDELQTRNLIEAIKQKVNQGTPILGICLGMQLLFSESEEFGYHPGLNLIKGKVVLIKSEPSLKIPQIGWNKLIIKQKNNPLFKDLPVDSEVYFAQSYYPVPTNPELTQATTCYDSQEFCVVVQKANIIGTLFHPEKSGEIGLTILKNFCQYYNI